MRPRVGVAATLAAALALAVPGWSAAGSGGPPALSQPREHVAPRAEFVPAVRLSAQLSRYFVVMRAPAMADRARTAARSGGELSPASQRAARDAALRSQEAAIADARARGGKVVYRYGTLVNAFSVQLSPGAARAMALRSDVASVQPVSIVKLENSTSVPFIGATKVWDKFGVRGRGMTLALVDTGIDYTHKDFGGPGNIRAYTSNDPNFVEPGTFPTKKVIGGYDFVGSNYDVLDDDTTNDVPRPDFDPLDRDGPGPPTGWSTWERCSPPPPATPGTSRPGDPRTSSARPRRPAV